MSISDDHNPFPSGSTLRPALPTQRSGTTWAVVALVSAVLWFGGFGSLVAICSAGWARTELRDSGGSHSMIVVANIALVLGVVGLVGAIGLGLAILL